MIGYDPIKYTTHFTYFPPPFSTKVLLPKLWRGAFVSYSGLFRGVYDHGVGPSMSIRNGGRALLACSHVITFAEFDWLDVIAEIGVCVTSW